MLARPAVAEQVPDGAWLAVTGTFEPGESIAGALTLWRTRGVKLGAAKAVRMAMIDTTTISSIAVKPVTKSRACTDGMRRVCMVF